MYLKKTDSAKETKNGTMKKKKRIIEIMCVGGHIGDRTTSGISTLGTWPPWGLSVGGS